MTQEQLAAKARISRTYLARLETARHDPTLSMLEKLVKALGVPVTELLEMTKKEPRTNGTKSSRPSWRIKYTGLLCQTLTVTVDSFDGESADKERAFRKSLDELTRWLGSLDPVELRRAHKVVSEEISRRPPATELLG